MNTSSQLIAGETTAAVVQERPGFKIQFIDIRARNNGIPQDNGGYTLAVKQRLDGQITVATAQCPAAKRFDRQQGRRTAQQRLRQGKYLVVQTKHELTELAQKLADKISLGNSVRVSLEHIDG